MTEQANCILNLDTVFQETKPQSQRYKNTEREVKSQKYIRHCKPTQLCQNWKTSNSNLDPLCNRNNACLSLGPTQLGSTWGTTDLPICKEVIEKYSSSHPWNFPIDTVLIKDNSFNIILFFWLIKVAIRIQYDQFRRFIGCILSTSSRFIFSYFSLLPETFSYPYNSIISEHAFSMTSTSSYQGFTDMNQSAPGPICLLVGLWPDLDLTRTKWSVDPCT